MSCKWIKKKLNCKHFGNGRELANLERKGLTKNYPFNLDFGKEGIGRFFRNTCVQIIVTAVGNCALHNMMKNNVSKVRTCKDVSCDTWEWGCRGDPGDVSCSDLGLEPRAGSRHVHRGWTSVPDNHPEQNYVQRRGESGQVHQFSTFRRRRGKKWTLVGPHLQNEKFPLSEYFLFFTMGVCVFFA